MIGIHGPHDTETEVVFLAPCLDSAEWDDNDSRDRSRTFTGPYGKAYGWNFQSTNCQVRCVYEAPLSTATVISVSRSRKKGPTAVRPDCQVSNSPMAPASSVSSSSPRKTLGSCFRLGCQRSTPKRPQQLVFEASFPPRSLLETHFRSQATTTKTPWAHDKPPPWPSAKRSSHLSMDATMSPFTGSPTLTLVRTSVSTTPPKYATGIGSFASSLLPEDAY